MTAHPQDGYPLYIKDIYFINTPPAIKKSQGILRFLKQETLKVCAHVSSHPDVRVTVLNAIYTVKHMLLLFSYMI